MVNAVCLSGDPGARRESRAVPSEETPLRRDGDTVVRGEPRLEDVELWRTARETVKSGGSEPSSSESADSGDSNDGPESAEEESGSVEDDGKPRSIVQFDDADVNSLKRDREHSDDGGGERRREQPQEEELEMLIAWA